MDLNAKQIETKNTVAAFAKLQKIPPAWAVSIAMAESSLGLFQRSPTGAKGLGGMTSIAMKDLLQVMEYKDDEIVDASCFGAYLHVLLDRFKTVEVATFHYCDPKDRDFYVKRVMDYMKEFEEDLQ